MMAQKTQYCYCYCSHSRWHTNYNSDLLSMSPMHRLLHDILCIVVILMGSRHNFWSLRVYSWKIICIIIIIIILYWFHIEICRACHVTKNSEYSCAKIRIVIDLKLSVTFLAVFTTNTDSFMSITALIHEQEHFQFLVTWLARQISNVRTN